MKSRVLIFLVFILTVFAISVCIPSGKVASADELSDAIKDETERLDLSGLEDFFDKNGSSDFDFLDTFRNILNGKYDGAESFYDYIKEIFFDRIRSMLPTFVSIIVIVFICGLLNGLKGGLLSENVSVIIRFATFLAVSLLLSGEMISIYSTTKNSIENIGIFSEIMSPIILTLMIASNGNASAAVYKPSVVFFSDFVIGVFYKIVMPLIGIIIIFTFVSHLSKDIRIKKFSDFFAGIIKWIFGIVVFCYGFIVTVQGLSVSAIDGISVKVAKYAILNSVPIVGGLIKDGLDVVTAGSIIIKNVVGVAGLTGLFYILLAPLLHIITFSLLLKLTSAVTDVFSDGAVSDFMSSLSKTVSFFVAAILTVALMAFLLTLLMVFSANSVL